VRFASFRHRNAAPILGVRQDNQFLNLSATVNPDPRTDPLFELLNIGSDALVEAGKRAIGSKTSQPIPYSEVQFLPLYSATRKSGLPRA
jgi:hypothetical protein